MLCLGRADGRAHVLRWPGRQLIAYAYIFLPVCGSFIHKLNSDSKEVNVFPAESMGGDALRGHGKSVDDA